MKDKNNNQMQRRSLLTGMGVAAAGLTVGAGAANAEESFEPARHDLDAWMGEMTGSHRVYIDSSSGIGGADALHFSRNILNAHKSAYGGDDSDYAMILCFRHYVTVFGYQDSIWKKYGKNFHQMLDFPDPSTGEAPDINLMQSTGRGRMPNNGMTVDTIQSRGVQIALCNAATKSIANMLSRAGHGEASDIYKELVDGAIPGSRFVSAGVMAVTRAQEYGFSVLTAG
jgi:hypothetical protein